MYIAYYISYLKTQVVNKSVFSNLSTNLMKSRSKISGFCRNWPADSKICRWINLKEDKVGEFKLLSTKTDCNATVIRAM